MKKSKVVYVVLILLVLFIAMAFLSTYALWTIKKKQVGENVIHSVCLDIEFENEFVNQNGITLEDELSWPVSDEQGMQSEKNKYSFKIVNKCDRNIDYIIGLEDLTENSAISFSYSSISLALDGTKLGKLDTLQTIENDNNHTNKKIYTGTVPKKSDGVNGEVHHEFQLWINLTSPESEIGKQFRSKLFVTAGQNIENNTSSGFIDDGPYILKVLSKEGTPEATKSNISVGDRLGFGTEEFYVIEIDGNVVKLLTRYILNVGPRAKTEFNGERNTVGLQDGQVGLTRLNVDDGQSIVPDWFNEAGLQRYGSVVFSDRCYWYDSENREFISPYEFNGFIYNNQSNLNKYIESYVNVLISHGMNATGGSLLSIQELGEICNTDFNSPYYYDNINCPNYIYETSYWLGSAGYVGQIWNVIANDGGTGYGNITPTGYYALSYHTGIRPVISVIIP